VTFIEDSLLLTYHRPHGILGLTIPATPPSQDVRTRAGFLFQGPIMKYEKLALTVEDQVKLLISRGLIVDDPENAEAALLAISYYRLSAYFVPFETKRGEVHEFYRGTRFEDIVEFYTFDHKLRVLVFDALERIETAFRTQIVYQNSLALGGWWYEDAMLFYSPGAQAHFLEEMDRTVGHSKEAFILHYNSRYSEPARPPAWIALEVASLGQLSKLFRNLRPSGAKTKIASFFGVGIPVLESWMECLTNIRNTCAHHARLWNKTLVIKPMKPNRTPARIPAPIRNLDSTESIYSALIVMQYCLRKIDTLGSFPKRLTDLLHEYPKVNCIEMGMPADWNSHPFWMPRLDKTNRQA